MRALWSARVSRSPSVPSPCARPAASRCPRARPGARAARRRRGRLAASSARASANLPLAVMRLGGAEEGAHGRGDRAARPTARFRRAGAASWRSASSGCRRLKAARRSKPASFSSLRRIVHSISLRASGSPIVFWTARGLAGLAAADEIDRLLHQRDVGGGALRRFRRRRAARPEAPRRARTAGVKRASRHGRARCGGGRRDQREAHGRQDRGRSERRLGGRASDADASVMPGRARGSGDRLGDADSSCGRLAGRASPVGLRGAVSACRASSWRTCSCRGAFAVGLAGFATAALGWARLVVRLVPALASSRRRRRTQSCKTTAGAATGAEIFIPRPLRRSRAAPAVFQHPSGMTMPEPVPKAVVRRIPLTNC